MAKSVNFYGLDTERGEEWAKAVLKSGTPELLIELQGFGRPGGTESLGGISKHDHARNFIRAHYPWVWQHWNEWLEMIFWAWCNYEEIGASGCMACVAGDTRLLDTSGAETPIAQLAEDGIAPMVMTLDGPVRASVPFLKGVEQLYEVLLSDGSRFEATAAHMVLNSEGRFVSVGSLRAGVSLLLAYDRSDKAVLSIRKTRIAEFYDLQVPNAHHYFAEGAIHHNSGKTYGFSLAAWMEWIASPMQTACVISSTTKDGIRSRVWPVIKRLRNAMFLNGQQIQYPCHLVDSRTMIQATKGDDKHSITSLAVQGGQLEESLGNLQGRHPERMVIFVDEGQQTGESVFSARFNLRGGTKLYRFASVANCSNPSGPFGQFIEPKAGWSSVKDSDESWETKTGIALHFDGRKSPNVIANKTVVPGLIERRDIDAIRAAKGEDSLEWWMYVVGFPAFSGVRNTVLTWAHILNSKAKEVVTWQGPVRWIAALDPAYTSGGDDCVLRLAKIGLRDDGKQTLGLLPPIKIQLQANASMPEEYQIAHRVKEECDAKAIMPEDFRMDGTAASALAAIISQVWKPLPKKSVVNYGASATERKMPGEDKTAKERCKNRVAEMWFSFAALVRQGQVRGLDAECAQEFCTRQYTLAGEKYILESKADMKVRTGGKSPDVSDATTQLGDLFRDIAGMDGGEVAKAGDDAWTKVAKRMNLVESYA